MTVVEVGSAGFEAAVAERLAGIAGVPFEPGETVEAWLDRVYIARPRFADGDPVGWGEQVAGLSASGVAGYGFVGPNPLVCALMDSESNKVRVGSGTRLVRGCDPRGIRLSDLWDPVYSAVFSAYEPGMARYYMLKDMTLGDIADCAPEHLAHHANLGIRALQELQEILSEHGLSMRPASSAPLSDADPCSVRIADLGMCGILSGRAANALWRRGVRSLSSLAALTEGELRSISNIGDKSVVEIESVLAQAGLSLAPAAMRRSVMR